MHDLVIIFLRFGGGAILGCLAVQCLIVISMAYDGIVEPVTRADVFWMAIWAIIGLGALAASFQ